MIRYDINVDAMQSTRARGHIIFEFFKLVSIRGHSQTTFTANEGQIKPKNI